MPYNFNKVYCNFKKVLWLSKSKAPFSKLLVPIKFYNKYK
jgi:hypothetical protein